MIRRLRVLHRFVFVALALALPALLVAGLRARRHTLPFPTAAVSTSDTSGFRILEKTGLGVRSSSGSIEVMPLRPLTAPDPLLYWSRQDSLGDGAMLIGPLEGMSLRRYSIPESGYLIIYSLGRREIVAVDRIELIEGRQ